MCGTSENDDQVCYALTVAIPDTTEDCFSRWQRAFQRSQTPLWVSSMSAKFYTQLLFLVLKNANNAKLDLDPLQGLCFVHGSLRNEIYMDYCTLLRAPHLTNPIFEPPFHVTPLKPIFLLLLKELCKPSNALRIFSQRYRNYWKAACRSVFEKKNEFTFQKLFNWKSCLASLSRHRNKPPLPRILFWWQLLFHGNNYARRETHSWTEIVRNPISS